jgi:hypothetical protein
VQYFIALLCDAAYMPDLYATYSAPAEAITR